MTGHRRLSKSIGIFDKAKQDTTKEFPGILGATFKGKTLVNVPDRAGYVYVRLRSNTSEILQAFNETVSPVYGLPVTVVRDTNKNKYYIKGRDIGQYSTWGGGASYQPRHAAQHGFSGGDIVWVSSQQFTPLCVTPASGTSGGNYVNVYPYVYYLDGLWHYIPYQSTSSLLSNTPTGSGAISILVYIDASGTVQTLAGSNFDENYDTIQEMLPYIPSLPDSSCIPLGFIRLVSGTSSIGWNQIFDLRPFINWWS